MTHVSGIYAWRQARTLTAALLLGTAVLGFAPGSTAFAATGLTHQIGDMGAEASTKPKPADPKDTGKQCTLKNADGSTEYYNPGEIISVGGAVDGKFKCGKDGKWSQVRTGEVMGPEIGTGGVYAP